MFKMNQANLERAELVEKCGGRVEEAFLSDKSEILAASSTRSSQSIVDIEAVPSQSEYRNLSQMLFRSIPPATTS